MIDMVGRLSVGLADRYRIERELGAGGMATVYLACDLKHDREVAIKVLHNDLARSLTAERFLREIAITARLNHPHILALLDSGVTGELLYYVMPVATGESLRDRLARGGALPVNEALRVAIDATEALVHAHAQGVVHRDIKPENVLLSGGHAIVVDFGIAKAVGQARDATKLTREGMSPGTPVYMAPEQAAGDGEIDQRADIYAVGALLFEMLAGTAAFAGTPRQIVVDKFAKEAPSVAPPCPAAPPVLVRLVARCLARNSAERPGTAEALLSDLRAIALAAAPAPQRRPRTALLVTGLGLLVAASILAVLFMRASSARWVHATALPDIQRLVDADQLDSAFALAVTAAERAPNDSAVDAVWYDLSVTQTFLSEPAGAEVSRAALNDTTRWIPIGTTPTPPTRIPSNAWFYRYTMPGYRTVTVMGARLGGSYVPIPSPIALRRLSDPDSDMVLLRGRRLTGTLYGLVGGTRSTSPTF
ncbi:MAG: serine/threonine-protein kinase [Longimicrobiales bacterium]